MLCQIFQTDRAMLVSGVVVCMGRLGLREGLALYLNEWGVYIARHFSGDDWYKHFVCFQILTL